MAEGATDPPSKRFYFKFYMFLEMNFIKIYLNSQIFMIISPIYTLKNIFNNMPLNHISNIKIAKLYLQIQCLF
jgi:hypothetical protein